MNATRVVTWGGSDDFELEICESCMAELEDAREQSAPHFVWPYGLCNVNRGLHSGTCDVHTARDRKSYGLPVLDAK